jgi:hypothetical protein
MKHCYGVRDSPERLTYTAASLAISLGANVKVQRMLGRRTQNLINAAQECIS